MMTLNLANEATEPLFSDIVMKTQGDITPPGENIVLYERDNQLNGQGSFFSVHAIKVKRTYSRIIIAQKFLWRHVIHPGKKVLYTNFPVACTGGC
ncbi:hypothetical protein [Erwinia psidii]|uniref:Uncharacterized protein n=1 Tax=Erwinia psidii TaxID=69224 RepID=A0A3N6V2M9_9GAMM|nr:hypothetical protein [Erwinia psidii]MCX8956336.1 hypothetical protein [Erwinia psidii]RQM39335.1 hypothetical protein EB241_06195 [Erwinia psidii]